MAEYVGQSVTRSGAEERVTGRLAYAADMRIPGMLHAKLVTAGLLPRPHPPH